MGAKQIEDREAYRAGRPATGRKRRAVRRAGIPLRSGANDPPPHIATTKGLRDRAILAVLLGCALRKCTVAARTDGRCFGRIHGGGDGRRTAREYAGADYALHYGVYHCLSTFPAPAVYLPGSWDFRIRSTESIVFQLRVVAGAPKSLSIWPR